MLDSSWYHFFLRFISFLRSRVRCICGPCWLYPSPLPLYRLFHYLKERIKKTFIVSCINFNCKTIIVYCFFQRKVGKHGKVPELKTGYFIRDNPLTWRSKPLPLLMVCLVGYSGAGHLGEWRYRKTTGKKIEENSELPITTIRVKFLGH